MNRTKLIKKSERKSDSHSAENGKMKLSDEDRAQLLARLSQIERNFIGALKQIAHLREEIKG